MGNEFNQIEFKNKTKISFSDFLLQNVIGPALDAPVTVRIFVKNALTAMNSEMEFVQVNYRVYIPVSLLVVHFVFIVFRIKFWLF